MQHHFIQNSRVLTVQKATLKELYWILIRKIEHKKTSQKYFQKIITNSIDIIIENSIDNIILKVHKKNTRSEICAV